MADTTSPPPVRGNSGDRGNDRRGRGGRWRGGRSNRGNRGNNHPDYRKTHEDHKSRPQQQHADDVEQTPPQTKEAERSKNVDNMLFDLELYFRKNNLTYSAFDGTKHIGTYKVVTKPPVDDHDDIVCNETVPHKVLTPKKTDRSHQQSPHTPLMVVDESNKTDKTDKTDKTYQSSDAHSPTPTLTPNKKKIVNICVEIKTISDLIQLCETYPVNDDTVEYNIDMKTIHKIKQPLTELNEMVGMKSLKENVVDQILYFIQHLHIPPNAKGANDKQRQPQTQTQTQTQPSMQSGFSPASALFALPAVNPFVSAVNAPVFQFGGSANTYNNNNNNPNSNSNNSNNNNESTGTNPHPNPFVNLFFQAHAATNNHGIGGNAPSSSSSSSSGDFMHTVLYGPPGTGKTEVAKILGKIFSNLGVLTRNVFKKVTRHDLVAGYMGQTALKTREVIKETLGGVLFIDEAYSLGNSEKRDSFSKECIETLCEALSDHKSNWMVIIAGYEKELNDCFFNYNEGLNSRFTWRFKMDDYKPPELKAIFEKKVRDNGWSISEDLPVSWFEKHHDYFSFYGRDMETLFSKTKIAHSRRVFCLPQCEKTKISMKDLEKGFELYTQNNEVKERLERNSTSIAGNAKAMYI